MRAARAQKRDANEASIVQALRDAQFEVVITNGTPFDLLVGGDEWCVMEVKTPQGRLTDSQLVFFNGSRIAPRVVVRSVEEALAAAFIHCRRHPDGPIDP